MALSLLFVVLISNATHLNSTAHHDDIDKVIDLILDEVTKIEESELTDYNYTRLIFFILLLIIIILVKSRLYKALFNCCCRPKKHDNRVKKNSSSSEAFPSNDVEPSQPVLLLSITKKEFDNDNKSSTLTENTTGYYAVHEINKENKDIG